VVFLEAKTSSFLNMESMPNNIGVPLWTGSFDPSSNKRQSSVFDLSLE
jgi:hypothetical protein